MNKNKPTIKEEEIKAYYQQEIDENTDCGKLTYEEYVKLIEETFDIIHDNTIESNNTSNNS